MIIMKNSIKSVTIEKISSILTILPENRSQEHLESILTLIKDIHFLSKISEENKSPRIHWEFCRLMTIEIFDSDECVIHFGEIGDKFYAIVSGSVSVLIPTKTKQTNNTKITKKSNQNRLLRSLSRHSTEKSKFAENFSSLKKKKTMIDFDFLNDFGEIAEMTEIKILKKGESFGELALLNNNPRSATIKCKEKSVFAVLSRKNFQKILSANSQKSIIEAFEYLKNIPVLSKIPLITLKNISYFLTEKTLKKGQILYEDKKKNNDFVYFIKHGEFKIIMTENVYSDTDPGNTLIRVGLKKNFNKTIQYDIVAKGKNEIIGDDIVIEEGKPLWQKCECISTFGIVYIMNVKVLIK